MSVAGAPLVNALIRGAGYYAAHGRPSFLQRQEHTPGRTYAHADLVGGVDGQAVALEAKMAAGDEFPLKRERAAQRAELQRLHGQRARVALVIEFTDHGEVYVVPWAAVSEFLAAAWRRSLSRDWCMVNGQLARQLHTGDRRLVFWLDLVEHPNRYDAITRVAEDRDGKDLRPIDGDLERDARLDARRSPKQLALHERLANRPRPGTPEHREYMLWLMGEGTDRQLRAGARGKAGRWRGGRG